MSIRLADGAELFYFSKVHFIGETVGDSIAMRFATLHPERLLSLAACTSPVTFDAHHTESAELIDREGIAAWVANTIGRRLDPEIVAPAYIRWYADQMAATTSHVVSDFQRQAPGGDLRPLIKDVQTPTLIMAAASLREEVLGDFRGAADLFPNGRLVKFPGVSGFVQHILPVPCARAWLDFASGLAS
jgi:pimeloyl-ACP methyl ester carboxylesterase